jgi:hypothetical protein
MSLFPTISGWWFGTVLLFHILGIVTPTDIFFRGVETTNQIWWTQTSTSTFRGFIVSTSEEIEDVYGDTSSHNPALWFSLSCCYVSTGWGPIFSQVGANNSNFTIMVGLQYLYLLWL